MASGAFAIKWQAKDFAYTRAKSPFRIQRDLRFSTLNPPLSSLTSSATCRLQIPRIQNSSMILFVSTIS